MSGEHLSMRTVLVTGATGFVGRAVCEKLMEDSVTLRGAVRAAGIPENLPAGVPAVSIGTIASDTDWSEALAGVDTVIHLAARVHVMNEISVDPLAAFRRVNVEGTERLARMAAAQGVRRFVFVSSVKVQGEETAVPYTEDDEPAPLDPYAVSKREAEDALIQVATETGLEIAILRAPLVYGPGVKANFLRLFGLVGRGLPLPFGSIRNRRSMVYVGNLVDAIVICGTHSKAAGCTFLVSDGDDVSTPQLIRRIGTALGRPARLIPFPPGLMAFVGKLLGRANAVGRLQGSLTVDSSKIRLELGWVPPYTMADGLAITAEWFKKKTC